MAGYAGSFLATLAVCVPGFVIAPLLILFFPSNGTAARRPVGNTVAHDLRHRPRPVLRRQSRRLFREGMLSAMQSEFITAARQGIGENMLLLRPLRIAILRSFPIPADAGDLLTGSFVIENIFQIPGIGVFLVNSSLNAIIPFVSLSLLYAMLLIG